MLDQPSSSPQSKPDFLSTKAFQLIKDFLLKINCSVQKEPQCQPGTPDAEFEAIARVIDETPLSNEATRFANAAMRDVIAKIHTVTDNPYLRESFGNAIRMDYGTGHELNFLCYLYTRHVGGIIELNEVASVLNSYFRLIRTYITKYNIEAAGARGCWSLDDYQMLPFLFGSAENIREGITVRQMGTGMYYEAWKYHGDTGMLAKVSLLSWSEINIGVFRMYENEVLGRRVVTQHFIYTRELPVE